jgi:hypothetical protein
VTATVVNMPLLLTLLAGVAFAAAPALAGRPNWMPSAPPLPIEGRVVEVRTVRQLRDAVTGARNGDTIMIADGVYRLDGFLELAGRTGVTIRGASGDTAKVELRGIGWDDTDRDNILRIQGCAKATVAYLTFAECHAYGIKLEQLPYQGRQLAGIDIYACNFRNIGTRAIKGTGGGGDVVNGGSIRYCNFENTNIPPKTWLFDGDYITAIDLMRLKDWVIADNYFHDIRGANGGGRGAIFVWVESANVISERNVIVDCDRSIAYGNPSGSTEGPSNPHNVGGIIRNNFIVAGADTGVEISWARGVKVYHNTILTPDDSGPAIHYHWNEISHLDIANNLVRGRIWGDKGGVVQHGNLTAGIRDAWFRNAREGDLHLMGPGAAAVAHVARLADCPEDFDRQGRRERTNIGADQP